MQFILQFILILQITFKACLLKPTAAGGLSKFYEPVSMSERGIGQNNASYFQKDLFNTMSYWYIFVTSLK